MDTPSLWIGWRKHLPSLENDACKSILGGQVPAGPRSTHDGRVARDRGPFRPAALDRRGRLYVPPDEMLNELKERTTHKAYA